jgi:predicted permease
LLTESLIVGLVGATLGLCLAQLLVRLVTKLNLEAIPRLDQAGLNVPVLLLALCLGFLSTLVAGLWPAIRAAQVDIETVLRQGGRGATGLARDSARSAYIAAEVALALVLLVSAGLLIRTAIAAQRVRPGFSPDNVVSGRTALPTAVYRDGKDAALAYENILEKLREQPGVMSAALTSKVPLSRSTVGLSIKQNAISTPLKQDIATELHYISDGYFATMRIPLKRGREFTRHDRADSTQVILVSDGLARRLWPGGPAIGETIRIPELEGRSEAWQVVGVVSDVRANGLLSEAPLVIYIPLEQVTTNPWHWIEQSLYLVARTRTEAISMSGLLQRALNQVDPELPLGDVRTMNQRLARSASLARFYTLILTLLGACGLLLTMAGIYGVVAYFVSRQRAEIGLRLALGSSASGVLLLIIRQGMRPVLLGVSVGLLASLMTTRLLASQLYGVSATDPFTLLSVTSILILVAVFACYLPARQAARLDPMVALRNE